MIENDDSFKAVSAGDQITAQKKFGQQFVFMNFARLIFSANDIPPAHANKFAYYRRWMIVPFRQTFSNNPKNGEKQKDPQLVEKLTTPEELSGIFNLFLYGLYQLIERGHYTYSSDVDSAERQYTLQSNSLKAFMDDCITDHDGDNIGKSEFFNEYKIWCEDIQSVKPATPQQVSRRLKKMGYEELRYRSEEGGRPYAWADLKLVKHPSSDKEVMIKLKAQYKYDPEKHPEHIFRDLDFNTLISWPDFCPNFEIALSKFFINGESSQKVVDLVCPNLENEVGTASGDMKFDLKSLCGPTSSIHLSQEELSDQEGETKDKISVLSIERSQAKNSANPGSDTEKPLVLKSDQSGHESESKTREENLSDDKLGYSDTLSSDRPRIMPKSKQQKEPEQFPEVNPVVVTDKDDENTFSDDSGKEVSFNDTSLSEYL
jgi:hypothetical protein